MWIIGVDEAGYGPNLGPFVMTSLACRVPDDVGVVDLWQRLGSTVARVADAEDGQLLIDDSKLVYTKRGLAGLERGVLATLGGVASSLDGLLEWICPGDGAEVRREAWYRGALGVPIHASPGDLEPWSARFAECCAAAGVGPWHVRGILVCPTRFNALLDEGGSKGTVLSHALTLLVRWQRANLPGEDALAFFIDKHGGRNTYAAMIQNALPDGLVFAERESLACSAYRVHGLGRELRMTFQPRADGEHLCVALASMASKYLREALMLEFNRFWREHVPDLKPTAGYPGDAARFFAAIRETREKLGLAEHTLWRRK